MLSESERAVFRLHDEGCGCRDGAHCCLSAREQAIEAILAARETALRDSIAREIEALLCSRDTCDNSVDSYNQGLDTAAAIARGGDHV